MAANRVWKEYKELTKEVSKNGPDKEISLAPIDDASIFEWNVRRSPLPCRAECPRATARADSGAAGRRRSRGRRARRSRGASS